MLANLLVFIFNLSITGTVIAIVIFIVKKITGQFFSPRWHYIIWFLLLAKLLVPFTVSSNVSLFNIIKPSDNLKFISYQESASGSFNKSFDIINQYTLEDKSNAIKDTKQDNPIIHNSFDWSEIAACIWLAGVLIMLFAAIFSYRRTFMRTTKASFEQQECIFSLLRECTNNNRIIKKINIRLSHYHTSPFIIGAFKPNLIIPDNIINTMDEQNLKIILIHEMMHLKHHDHIIRIICYFVQALHWFNPVIWVSLRLMSRDCEIACDTAVLRSSNIEMRKDYAMLLLKTAQMSSTRRSIVHLAAFSESNLKKRIINIARFKKHSAISFIAAAIILGLLTTILMTGAADKKLEILTDSFENVKSIWLSQYIDKSTPGSSLVNIGSNKQITLYNAYPNFFANSNIAGQPIYYQRNLNKINDEIACKSYYDTLYNILNRNSGKTVLKHRDELEDPNLNIEIIYKDGHTDFISSDSNNNKIYRMLGNGNYLECTNTELVSVIKYETLNAIMQSSDTDEYVKIAFGSSGTSTVATDVIIQSSYQYTHTTYDN